MIASVVNFKGSIDYDKQKPDGAPRKLMDSSRLKNLGWLPKIGLEEGILLAYKDFLKTIK
jgi:GDP-L-fucose synthase